jgi:hypothetical protein
MSFTTPQRTSRTNWPLIGLEAGGVLFVAGLLVLDLNPLVRWYGVAFLDSRVSWWNAAGETLAGAGLLIGSLALIACVAAIVSRYFRRSPWPYIVAALLVAGTVLWISPTGITRTVSAHFEWNAADGFQVFRLQGTGDDAGSWREPANRLWQEIVAIQIEPILQNYFKANDWQKMNGDEDIIVVRIVPIARPIAIGSSGETLEVPDQSPLMQAASQGDVSAAQRLLAGGADVNTQDQNGQNALIYACRSPKADPAVVKLLLAAGADVNVRSRNGYTALLWAQTHNDSEIIRVLRRAGARP